jgi:acetyl esterase/lipase
MFVVVLRGLLLAALSSGPLPVEEIRDVAYGPDPMQRLDVYRPKGVGDRRPVVIWIHGGGWQAGDKRELPNGIGGFGPSLVELGYVAVSCNYRLAPKHKHPAQVDDVRRVVRWVRANAPTYGIDPERVGVVGISAGGHLAAALAVRAPRRGDELDRFRGQAEVVVSLNGVTDLRQGGPSNPPLEGAYHDLAGDDPKARADVSPITHVGRDSSPVLFVVGDQDTLVPNAQSTTMADALTKAGVESRVITIKGAGHGIFPDGSPPAREAAIEFLGRHLKP